MSNFIGWCIVCNGDRFAGEKHICPRPRVVGECVVCNGDIFRGKKHICPIRIESAINAAHRRAQDDDPPSYQPPENLRLAEGLDMLERIMDEGWPGEGEDND